MTAEEFLQRWLLGSTCHRDSVRRTVEWQRGPFVLLKHHGHSEYCGRFSGTAWCETWYGLYDLRNRMPDCLGQPAVRKWSGRWSAFRQRECAEICGSLER